MDFDLSEEQRMLKESVERLISDRYDFETRKKYLQDQAGYSQAMWAQYAEMGLLGLPFEERFGGRVAPGERGARQRHRQDQCERQKESSGPPPLGARPPQMTMTKLHGRPLFRGCPGSGG